MLFKTVKITGVVILGDEHFEKLENLFVSTFHLHYYANWQRIFSKADFSIL